MTAISKKSSPIDLLENLYQQQGSPSKAQTEAFAQIMQSGVPTLRTERWKYTPLRKALHAELKLAENAVTSLAKHPALEALKQDNTDCEVVQIVNGNLYGEFSNNNALIQLSDEILEGKETHTDHFISNLNLAFLRNNLQLQLTATVEPLLVFHIHSSQQNDLCAYQISIDVDDQCSAKVLIVQTSDQQNTQVPVITVDAGKNSTLDLFYYQDLAESTAQLSQTNVQLQRDAVVNMVQLELGGELIRHNIVADALESGAEFNLRSLYVQNNRQHVDTHLDMYHHAAHTQSTMLAKGILDDRARCVFNGKIYVEKDAQQINANLNNNTLLLSQRAEINTKPELEIYADDVKCAHGATVGQIDEQAVFYLRSRGLSRTHAEQTLTSAFARETYLGIIPDALSAYLDSHLGFLEG